MENSSSNDMLNNIFEYWYAQEFFSPSWPIKPKEDCDLCKNKFPWATSHDDFESSNSNVKIRRSYDVYFGKLSVDCLIKWLFTELNLDFENASVEKDGSITCLFAIKIDEHGRYVADSFALSSFVWAICKLVSERSFSAKLSYSDLDELQRKFNVLLLEKQEETDNFEISNRFLYELFIFVCDQIKLSSILSKYTAWCKTKKDFANSLGEFPPLNPATELMQSFYLKDLKIVQRAPTETISDYLRAKLKSELSKNRIQIDCDTLQMQAWLNAESFPMGAWPSTYSPSLMQQLGINLAISDKQKVFSVNGPPGTGKTTLLKEIVASNVVQRAIAMLEYDRPDDAFTKGEFQNPVDEYSQTFYKLNSELSAFGMIVASNNNAAVENISIELPKAISKDRTGHFSSANSNDTESTYFADIATSLLGKPAWGLISARLGKKPNLSDLKERLWWAKDNATLQHYYKNYYKYYDKDSNFYWKNACKSFQEALHNVVQERNKIASAQAALARMNEAEKEFLAVQASENGIRQRYEEQENQLEHALQTLHQLEHTLQMERENVVRLKKRIFIFKRLFHKWFSSDPIVIEWKNTEKQITNLEIEIVHQQRKCTSVQNDKDTLAAELASSIAKTKQAKEHWESTHKVAETYRMHFKGNWADADFWKDISKNEASQSACPWTTPEYDKLREELFYQALMLHKAFILSSNRVKQNLRHLFNVWDGKITGADRNAAYGDLLNTLLLVIPVISTTFASVQTFLDGIGSKQLGMLIVDEAGQATPQSVLGAMWRTKKAIIVGDPLQVEPIVTIPKELQERFANEYEIPSAYRVPELSVQSLADSINLYGGYRFCEEQALWLGCPLVTHRRCLDPMFSISNNIAYNGRMFLKTPSPKPETSFVLQKSVWFDCKGSEKGNKDHTVPAQIDLAARIFENAINTYHGLPDLYLITPFTTVAHALSDAIKTVISRKISEMKSKDINEWLDDHCGTVHTFQGKEAAEVLFVLGCDAQSGKGAAKWVGQKPNIVNVAVSRAKYRLGVIGDYELWKNIPYVQDVCHYLAREAGTKL